VFDGDEFTLSYPSNVLKDEAWIRSLLLYNSTANKYTQDEMVLGFSRQFALPLDTARIRFGQIHFNHRPERERASNDRVVLKHRKLNYYRVTSETISKRKQQYNHNRNCKRRGSSAPSSAIGFSSNVLHRFYFDTALFV
jgi:hypothetical protein